MGGRQEEMTGTKEAPQTPNLLHVGKFHAILSSRLQWTEDRGGTVVKVLCYKSEGRWFDPSWCNWNFSLA